MFKHLTFEGVEKKDNKECNLQRQGNNNERRGNDLLSLIHI